MARAGSRTTFLLLRWGAFAAVLFLVVRALLRQFAAITWVEVDFVPAYVALAAGSVLASSGFWVVCYRLVLASFAEPPAWPGMFAIAWIPPVGKYLPGKIASLAGAVWLLRRYEIPDWVAVQVVFVLNGLGVLVGLSLAAPLWLSRWLGLTLPVAWLCWLGLIVGVAGCGRSVVWPATRYLLVRRFGCESLRRRTGGWRWSGPIIVTVGQWVCTGLALWFVARSVTAIPVGELPRFVSAGALAMTLGFVAVFAPAGLGVREGILLVALSPIVGAGPAAIVAVAMRFVQTVVEIALAAVGVAILRLLRKKEVSAA